MNPVSTRRWNLQWVLGGALLAIGLSCALAALAIDSVRIEGQKLKLALSVDTGDVNNDLWAVWGSSATDVYAVGTVGTNLHYDGNPAGTWLLLPSISP